MVDDLLQADALQGGRITADVRDAPIIDAGPTGDDSLGVGPWSGILIVDRTFYLSRSIPDDHESVVGMPAIRMPR
ncbi:hypothetical protein [Microbacterium sp. KHB019]|uniref:hypothetical protein n=1 Tax=Microbacterium sp. KHB019 TaxID=3129770 RepID=UPI0030791B76